MCNICREIFRKSLEEIGKIDMTDPEENLKDDNRKK